MAESETDGLRTGYFERLSRQVEQWLVWLISFIMFAGIAGSLSLNFIQASQVDVALGMPSPQRIESPQTTTFVSDRLTELARDAAALEVGDIYTDIDRSIARTQINSTRELFNFIEDVRADSLATREWKISALERVSLVEINATVAILLLDMDATALGTVESQAIGIINALMRNEIREENTTQIADAVQREIEFDVQAEQENVLTAIVPQLIKQNSIRDDVATAESQQQARDAIEPVTVSVQKDQVLLLEGEVVSVEKLEMLEALGLTQQETNWAELGQIVVVSALAVVLIILYYQRYQLQHYQRRRYLFLLLALVVSFLFAAQMMVSQQRMLGYLFPAAALAMLLAVIFDGRFAGLVVLVVGGLIGFSASNSLEFAFYAIVGSLFAIFSLRDTSRINAFFRAGLFAAVGNLIVIAIFNLATNLTALEILQTVGLAVASGGLAAMLTIGGFFLTGSLFGITTMLQLQELSRFDQPLLQELLHRAPGTYHHSIMVANLAEQAADRIGVNSLLVRVGAFYHDIGKMKHPQFFTENQDGHNPHDMLDPYRSAEEIIGHVTGGLSLARKRRLPERVQDFIVEHHGTHVLGYFYKKACDQPAEDGSTVVVDEDLFRYPGPTPRSKETAIVMMADVVEAASKAVQPNNVRAIEKLVRSLVDKMLKENQLDNSQLTLGEIRTIRESFTETLKGRYHVRVKYAGNEKLIKENTPAIEGEVSEANHSAEPAQLESTFEEADMVDEVDEAADPT